MTKLDRCYNIFDLREAAQRRMVIDFHGAYKPAGLRRAYPNVLTREGLIEVIEETWISRGEGHILNQL